MAMKSGCVATSASSARSGVGGSGLGVDGAAAEVVGEDPDPPDLADGEPGRPEQVDQLVAGEPSRHRVAAPPSAVGVGQHGAGVGDVATDRPGEDGRRTAGRRAG